MLKKCVKNISVKQFPVIIGVGFGRLENSNTHVVLVLS